MNEREAFEAWFNRNYVPHNMEFLHLVNSYTSNKVNAFWEAWQAALAAQVSSSEQQAQQPTSETLKVLLDGFQELNMGNYGDDDVRHLNNWAIDAYEELKHMETLKKCLFQAQNASIDLASQLQSQAQQSQWMPIETAPKDRSVMLYTNKVLPVYVGRKRYGNLGEPQQDACEWRCDSGGHYSTPKFWMPIQPAPEGEKP